MGFWQLVYGIWGGSESVVGATTPNHCFIAPTITRRLLAPDKDYQFVAPDISRRLVAPEN